MASRSLKHLSRRPVRVNDLAKALSEIHSTTDQATALIHATLVERTLERVILSRMTRLTRKQRLNLFDGMAPLSSFSAKIKIAHALAIIGPQATTDLDIIKDIRNVFAHSFHPLTFRRKEIATYCRRLKTPERSVKLGIKLDSKPWPPRDPKIRFQVSCWIFFTALSGKAVAGPRAKRSRDIFSRHVLC